MGQDGVTSPTATLSTARIPAGGLEGPEPGITPLPGRGAREAGPMVQAAAGRAFYRALNRAG